MSSHYLTDFISHKLIYGIKTIFDQPHPQFLLKPIYWHLYDFFGDSIENLYCHYITIFLLYVVQSLPIFKALSEALSKRQEVSLQTHSFKIRINPPKSTVYVLQTVVYMTLMLLSRKLIAKTCFELKKPYLQLQSCPRQLFLTLGYWKHNSSPQVPQNKSKIIKSTTQVFYMKFPVAVFI